MDRHSEVGRTLAALAGSEIVTSDPLAGGDVAASYRVELVDGRTVFAKTHTNPPANFFDTEARGLAWLRAADALRVPAVIGVSDEPPLLVLEWIDESHRRAKDDAAFGAGLAQLHHAGADCFGRSDRRTTGSRGLPNEPCETWVDFYASQRLLPLAQLALETNTYDSDAVALIEQVAARLDIVGGPPEPAARLHGDLWAGNRIVDSSGRSWLIDPACHGGHREFDLAMMQLFGGFSAEIFTRYDEVLPLADGWHDRIALHQLAPLLVHAIKFGGSYVTAGLDSVRRYC